jgi:hypothetical protein
LDDSELRKDETENGKNAVGRVMKAPGDWMKLRGGIYVALPCASDRQTGFVVFHARDDASSLPTVEHDLGMNAAGCVMNTVG